MGHRRSALWFGRDVFDNAQAAHRQFVDLERPETRLLDGEPADRQGADRNRADGDGPEGRGRRAPAPEG